MSTKKKAGTTNAKTKKSVKPVKAPPAVWSVVTQTDGYASSIKEFEGDDAKKKAEAYRQENGGTLVKGRQMFNEPVGQVEEDDKPAPAAKPAKATKQTAAPKEPHAKKISGLDAAFEVLKAKGEPMTCKAIVDEMLAKGVWKTGGKTPSATIYSAMLREIDSKPGESRFKKVDRGLFTVASLKT